MLVPGISDQLLVALMIVGTALGIVGFGIISTWRLDSRNKREREKAAAEGRTGK